MARQTKVVFVLLLALAATAFGAPCCPDGWEKLQGRCYKYQATRQDWASAEKTCLGLDAHLVSIRDENEHQQIKALIKAQDPQESPTWIGLSSCEKNLNWFWSDGTKVTYTKWNPGEPNSLPKECCTHMNVLNGGVKNWNDIPCDIVYPFVCVKSAV